MKLEACFRQYPSMKSVFWPAAEKISWESRVPHPLISLVLDNEKRSCHVAQRTDHCCKMINKQNAAWLKKKAATILTDRDLRNVSAALGEIRAFGELIWVWQKKVQAGDSGNDFSIITDAGSIKIEVNTPQHRTKRNRIEHEPSLSKNISSQVIEIFPFGWPERLGKDNAQGEAVSKLAQIKEEEHQFAEDGINILWFDLKDPTLWQFDFGTSQFEPVAAFQEQMTSGAFWNAFFGQNGTPIFEALPMGGYDVRKSYHMEFDGRFWQQSKIDFVVADTRTDQIVFQNPNRSQIIPDWVFRDLHRFFAFNVGLSWLDWPSRAQLKNRVEMTLRDILRYENAFADS